MAQNSKKSLAFAAIALAAGALASQSAFAQDQRVYVGASVGQAKAKEACSDLAGIGFSGNCDNTDTAGKLLVGYQFNPYWAVEGGYADLGKATFSGIVSGLAVSGDAAASTLQLVAVGTLPLANNFSVFGKAGVHRWDLKVRTSAGGFASSQSRNGTDFTYGIGVGYEFTKNAGVRLEWERFQNVGDQNTTGQSHVDLVSVGLRYRF